MYVDGFSRKEQCAREIPKVIPLQNCELMHAAGEKEPDTVNQPLRCNIQSDRGETIESVGLAIG